MHKKLLIILCGTIVVGLFATVLMPRERSQPETVHTEEYAPLDQDPVDLDQQTSSRNAAAPVVAQEQSAPPEIPLTEKKLWLNPEYDHEELSYLTSDNFTVWYGDDLDASTEEVEQAVRYLLTDLEEGWRVGTEKLKMSPPESAYTYRINAYVSESHDSIPDGAGAGGDGRDDIPGIVIPGVLEYLDDPPGPQSATSGFTIHELFHALQFGATTEYADLDDGWWAIESTANWFVHYVYPQNTLSKGDIAAYTLNPQLPLWANDFNQGELLRTPYLEEDQESTWTRLVHHYGAQIWWIYLFDYVTDVSLMRDFWLYDGEEKLPQSALNELLADRGIDMSKTFADFAARNAVHDYPFGEYLKEQEDFNADDQWSRGDDNRVIAVYGDAGTNSMTRPASALTPGGWAYNTIQVNSENGGTYEIVFDGDEYGDEGNTARFAVRLVRAVDVADRGNRVPVYQEMSLTENTGTDIITVSPEETLYLIVASVPHSFTGNETYSYQYRITKQR